MSVVIRELEDRDKPIVNDFFNRVHGTNRTLDQFLWEVERGPKGPAIFTVAEDPDLPGDDRIVGTQSIVLLETEDADGERRLSGKAEHTLVDPRYRGQNLFARLFEPCFERCRERGVRFLWAFTYARKPFERIGFDRPFHVSQAVSVLRWGPAHRYFVGLNPRTPAGKRLQLGAMCAGSLANGRMRRAIAARGRGRFALESGPVSDWRDVITRAWPGAGPLFGLVQDDAFVGWRVRGNPYPNAYEELSVRTPGAASRDGVVVTNLRPDGLAYLTQMAFTPDVPRPARVAILSDAVRALGERGAWLVRFNAFRTNAINLEEIDVLKAAGFLVVDRGIDFVWMNLDETAPWSPESFVLSRMAYLGSM